MNATDFATIEQQLGVVLPEVFKKFMESFPNNATDELSNDCDSIPCNGEQFAIHQRLGFFNPEGYDYYELQPELRSRRFIEVGGDGCGNYYCMPGDDTESDELWFWEHDPHDGLTKSEHLSLTAYLENGEWELVTVPDPFEEYTGGVYVIRAYYPAAHPSHRSYLRNGSSTLNNKLTLISMKSKTSRTHSARKCLSSDAGQVA